MTFSLAASFGLLVLVVVGLILGTQLYVAAKNTVALASRTGKLTTELIAGVLEDHLHHVEEQVRHIVSAIDWGEVDLADERELGSLLRGSMAGLPQVHAVAYIDDRLQAVGAERESHEQGGHGNKVSTFSADWRSDSVAREAATAAANGGLAVWLSPRWHIRFNEPVLSIAMATSNDTGSAGTLVAYVGVDELSHALEKVNTLSNTRTFILHGRSEVLAHTDMHHNHTAAGPEHPLPEVEDSVDPVLAAIWDPGARIDQHMDLGATVRFHAVEVDGKRYVFLYDTLKKYGDKPWIIGGYQDYDVIHNEFGRLELFALLGLMSLIAAIVAAGLLGRRIARPIRRIADAARKVGDLDLNAVAVLPGSRIIELDDQSRAFNSMVTGLRWFDHYVPRDLVRKLMHHKSDITHEDRLVTVLFTDIVGFTSYSESRPAGEIARYLNHHFALVVECIENNGGTVDKFIGDSVMAVWGAPEADDRQADNACKAAIAVSEALTRDNASRVSHGEPPVRVRMGIHSGMATVGNIGAPGRVNYTIVGDVVNVASRMEAMAKTVDDERRSAVVLISETTRSRLLSDEVSVRSLGSHAVRGRRESMEVFALGSTS